MSRQTKTQITIHTRQRVIVHRLPESLSVWCKRCGEVVTALTPEALNAALMMNPADLDELLRSSSVHQVDSAASAPICGKSLSGYTTAKEISVEGEQQ